MRRLSFGVLLPVVPFFCVCCLGSPTEGATAAMCQVDPSPGGSEGPAVLFVGNSLTYWNNMPQLLAGLLTDADITFREIQAVAFADFGLADHWDDGTARSRIAEGGWDVVVLQQGPSATEGRPSLLEYSELFAEEIRAVGGEPALYMVWPSSARSFDFDGVSESYQAAADQVNGLLFPAGEAWRAAWRRDGALELYHADGFHPSTMGSYLAALVMFEQLGNRTPSSLSASFCVPSMGRVELSPDVASLLQAAAAEANDQFARDPR